MLKSLLGYGLLAESLFAFALLDQSVQFDPMPLLLLKIFFHLNFVQVGCQFQLFQLTLLRFFQVVRHFGLHVGLASRHFSLVVPLHLCVHVPLGDRLLSELVLELVAPLFDLHCVKIFLMELDFPLALNVRHLVPEVALHLKILSELNNVVSFGLNTVLSRVLVDHTPPESVLLFLRTNEG